MGSILCKICPCILYSVQYITSCHGRWCPSKPLWSPVQTGKKSSDQIVLFAPTLFFKCCSDCDFNVIPFNLPVFVDFPALDFFTSWAAVQSGLFWALNGRRSWRRLHFVNLSTDVRFRPTGCRTRKNRLLFCFWTIHFLEVKMWWTGLIWESNNSHIIQNKSSESCKRWDWMYCCVK